MKKVRLMILSCCLLCSMLLYPSKNFVTYAAQMFKPAVLTTGSDEDFKNAREKATYNFTSKGSEIYRLDVPKNGALEWSLFTLKPGQINVNLHKKADASDLPTYAAFTCTADRGNTFVLRQYIKKGTYYLKFPRMDNTYSLTLLLYPSEGGKITHRATVAGYCDAGMYQYDDSIPFINNTYTYKATETGYLTIDKKNIVNIAASMSVSFYNSNGKKITDFSSDHDISGKVAFPVKKGVAYKIKVGVLKDGQQFYQMKFGFVSLSEKSGTSKAKAKSVKLKKSIKGMVYAEESVKTQDWYKFSLSKAQKLKITYTGKTISGSVDIIIYDKNKKKIGTYHVMPMIDNTNTKTIKNANKGTTLPKGTYYIKVIKQRKQAAGYYNFKLHS